MPIGSNINPFSQLPQALVPRSEFDCSYTHKTTLDGGYLVPVFVDDILPGDTISLSVTLFARFATQFVPVMDNAYVEFHLWSVPYRLTWDNWPKFMGERKNPNDSIDYLMPKVKAPDGGYEPESMMNYLALPAYVKKDINAAFPRSCNLVYNEWYRDENLQDSLEVPMDDGPDDGTMYKLFRRGKRGDYFTTALPQPQKGPAVMLALGEKAPVVGNGIGIGLTNGITNAGLSTISGQGNSILYANLEAYGQHVTEKPVTTSGQRGILGLTTDPEKSGLYADLSSAIGPTINSFRQAVSMQQFLERDMMAGTRYIEIIFSHFGVTSPDARLQRPEFLGSFTARLNQNTVAQTSQSTQGSDGSPQANLSAYSVFSVAGNSIKKSFTEHSVLIGFVNIRADLTYQYGVDRMFTRDTRYDFAWPEFAHLGLQEIKMGEIYAIGTEQDNEIFGYTERYNEYRFRNNRISGKLASNVSGSLDVWHFAQKWENAPRLNSEFIEDKPPFERCIAVQNEPQFILDCDFEYYKATCLPKYGTPGLTRI